MEDLSGPRPGRRKLAVVAGISVAVLAVAAGAAVVFWPRQPAAVATPEPKPSRPPTPFELAAEQLDAQVAALLRGDEKGWLAAVDPARPELVARYRNLYRNLRGLGVSHAEFHAVPVSSWDRKPKPGTVYAIAQLGYCFSGVACPTWRRNADAGPPKASQELTFELIKGRYLITVRTTPKDRRGHLEPAPWDGGALVFARGERVTVAAARSQAKHAGKVLAAAEKAAVIADRFAGYLGNPQKHYRIYLADDRTWRTWYGGGRPSWYIGYALPLNSVGTDVVLKTDRVLADRQPLAVTVQHELGHVVTLAGLTRRETRDDQWLLEGIAEYIGAHPRPATATDRRRTLAAEFRRRDAPRSIAVASLRHDADDRTVDRLYAMGLFATSCMAEKYGERKLLAFVDRVLRRGEKPDPAARAAYGKPFAEVDRACLKWIKGKVV